MAKYKVINNFKDKTHDDHIYFEGDVYPAEGKKLVKSRADFLTEVHKNYGIAFLQEVKEEKGSVKGKVINSDVTQ